MNEKLVVKNFGPISNAELDIRKYSIFIGSQASGKSTVAKLIAIFKDIEFIENGCREHGKKFAGYNIANFFLPTTYLEYSNPHYQIVFSGGAFSVAKQQAFSEKIASQREKVLEIIRNFLKTNKELRKGRPDEETYVQELYNANWKTFFDFSVEQTYIPAERMLLSLVKENPFSLFNNFALPEGITNFGLKFEQAKRSIPVFEVDFLGVTLKIEEGKQRVYYNESKYLDLSECASGFQAILPVLLVLQNLCTSKTYPSFIIEEPELSLFPATQKRLVDFIISSLKNNRKSGDLIITTHSPYILSSFNILLLAYISGVKNSERISKIVPRDIWINPDEFNAFYFTESSCRQIFDRELNLISGNELDSISEDIGDKFENLMEIFEGSNG